MLAEVEVQPEMLVMQFCVLLQRAMPQDLEELKSHGIRIPSQFFLMPDPMLIVHLTEEVMQSLYEDNTMVLDYREIRYNTHQEAGDELYDGRYGFQILTNAVGNIAYSQDRIEMLYPQGQLIKTNRGATYWLWPVV